jgi:hypothetical protein
MCNYDELLTRHWQNAFSRQFEHDVVRGENLWKLARRQLKQQGQEGSASAIIERIHLIIEANKDNYPGLAVDPNIIIPGMKLRLPW